MNRNLLLLVLIFVSSGCATLNGGERRPMYFWGMYNASDHKIHNFRWYYQEGNTADSAGKTALRPGQASRYGPGFDPIPQRVILEWERLGHGDQSEDIAVAENIPDLRRFKGTIWLRYDGEGWEAVPMTDEQATQRAIARVKNATVPDPENFP